jgi:hypothetical protein
MPCKINETRIFSYINAHLIAFLLQGLSCQRPKNALVNENDMRYQLDSCGDCFSKSGVINAGALVRWRPVYVAPIDAHAAV